MDLPLFYTICATHPFLTALQQDKEKVPFREKRWQKTCQDFSWWGAGYPWSSAKQ